MKNIDEEKRLSEYATRLESSSGSQSTNDTQIEYLYLTPIDANAGRSRGMTEGRQGVSAQPAQQAPSVARRAVRTAATATATPASAGGASSDFTIGHYHIERAIGRGGMGDVYLARDTKLGRPVAVKLLRADYNPTESRVRRFHQEARAVCALNHPNIVTIYEVGESDGAPFIVSEFIEGLTLRRLIPPHGMKAHLALDISIQIASALSAAHLAGIVHRDIKPENVMVRGDGYVKVLDFGLAKLSDALEGRTASPVAKSAPPRVVLGTISYMSPEQARGLNVDGRTDIFSLGIVLYEMVTGRKPFTGPSTSDVLAAILNKPPVPPTTHVPDLPEEVEWIINNAICKDVESRYPTINEMLRDLREVKDELAMRSRQERKATTKEISQHDRPAPTRSLSREPVHISPPAVEPPAARGPEIDFGRETVSLQEQAAEFRSRSRSRSSQKVGEAEGVRKARNLRLPLTVVIGFLLLSLLLAVGIWQFGGTGKAVPFERSSHSRLTSSGQVGHAAISPDGRYVALSQAEADGREGLWLRQVGAPSAVAILPPADATIHDLKFSRDGAFLFFLRQDRATAAPAALYKIPTLGGALQRLLPIVNGTYDLSPDGTQLAYFRSFEGGEIALMIADTATWQERKLASRWAPNEFMPGTLAWSEDGERLACGVMSMDGEGERYQSLLAVEVGDGREHALSRDRWRFLGDPAWLPNGQGVVVIGGALDARTEQIYFIAPDGRAHPVTRDLSRYAKLSLTADGRTIAAVRIEDPLSAGRASDAVLITAAR